MTPDVHPGHDGRNLAIQRQPIRQIQQLHQVTSAEIGHLVRIDFVRVGLDVRDWRAGGHERVARDFGFGGRGRAHHEHLHVVHAGPFEAVGGEKGGLAGEFHERLLGTLGGGNFCDGETFRWGEDEGTGDPSRRTYLFTF